MTRTGTAAVFVPHYDEKGDFVTTLREK